MGLLASILEPKDLGNCSNGGISATAKGVCIVNVPGPFKPSPDRPAVLLIKHPAGEWAGVIAVPASEDGQPLAKPGAVGPMSGGCFIVAHDSRFSAAVAKLLGARHFYGAIALHDRYETQAAYDANFD